MSESEIQERVQGLQRFAALAAHELAAPLHVVAGYASLLEDTELSGEQRAHVERIAATAARMQETLEALRGVVDGAVAPRMAAVELNDLCAQVVADFNDVEISVGDLPQVRGDAGQLRALLRNLIENAVKYGAHAINVSSRRDGSAWEISVRDDGVGIAEADQQRIFEPFKRLQRSAPGSGLGLWLCSQVVAAHGGELRVDSRVGGPTTFSFTIAG